MQRLAPVAVRLAGGGESGAANVGKPDCYRYGLSTLHYGGGQARSLTRFVFISCLFSMKCQALRKVEKIFHMKKI
ncbi:hypothetical protein ACI2KS_00385 [Pseudomonas sp. NPDC087358]|uniref:hypothetical protein n=1 Tax=Pseudomonas sp. NPDC087358 TaxID=3364439 RepID=UPI00384EF5C2